ncbi:5-oxoprolinase subunit C family protein [Tautonia sociabilis]|uniref:5-oxoprolinase subunit C family protein n=1 Tax=Tautonia sociabilis TaxID=2080755 RepID=UPI0013159BD7|nr:biotin-dependent carboxyltransferase family protein [Tautonia sociabilis]
MTERDELATSGLTVLHPGAWTTVQDLGRLGLRSRGVPPGGAFDSQSHELANALAGNPPGAATLELVLLGGKFRADGPLAVALAGAPMPARVLSGSGSRTVLPPIGFGLLPGDVLELGGLPSGARTYLAVRGGWRTPIVSGSRSSERPLREGERIPALPSSSPIRRPRPCLLAIPGQEGLPIRIIEGPDAELLVDRDWHQNPFVVSSESDRMGLRLDGPPIQVRTPPDRPSIPVLPGGIQVSGGRPILLGVAAGTMGGYPLVAVVASADLPRLAQARPRDVLRFAPISLAEARRLDRESRRARRGILLRLEAAVGGAGTLADPERRPPGSGPSAEGEPSDRNRPCRGREDG